MQRESFVRFAEWKQIDTLITNTGLAEKEGKWLADTGCEVEYVSAGKD